MPCPTCSSDNPEVAAYCHKCGSALRAGAGATRSYAVASSEGVRQFALISTVMPHTSRESADNYRWAMILASVLVVGATALGLLPVAVAAAALLVPLAYLVYIYDVNLWEDAPVAVVLGVFVVSGALALLVSLFFFDWVFAGQFQEFAAGGRARSGFDLGSILVPLLVFAVLLPVVSEVLRNLPGVVLARMPQFDDMIDGLTFGVAAGTAYAAVETLVLYRAVFTSGELRTTEGLAGWIVVVVNLMVVKSLVYGTSTGIAVAAFSGKGEGYDGFTAFYLRNLAFACLANVAYWLGVRLLAYLPYGQALGLLWGFLVLAVLVVRIRVMMQAALLEAAVEDAAKAETSSREVFVETFCPECENMLLSGAQFCIVCGESVRAVSRQTRRQMAALPADAPGDPSTEEPTEGSAS